MPGPRPQDLYNPTPTVSPTEVAPNDYLSVRANPAEAGVQIGQALEGVGQKGQAAGQEIFNTALQIQGLANEHAANMAELQLATQGGQVYDKYRQLEGLSAANAKDSAIQAYLDVNQKIRAGLPNMAAQRAYDALATRRMSYTIQDMNAYAADQTKKAYRQGHMDRMQTTVDQYLKYSSATNPSEIGYGVGSLRGELNAYYTEPGGVGLFSGVPVQQGPDGKLVYDQSTPEGRFAQASYDQASDKYIGQLYTNVAKSLELGDVNHPGDPIKAADFVEANRDKMGAKTADTLLAHFMPKVRSEQVRSSVEDDLNYARLSFDQQGTESYNPSSVPNNAMNVKTSDLKSFENPRSPEDGVILGVRNLTGGKYNGLTIDQIANKWTGGDNSAGWSKTVQLATGLRGDQVPDLKNPDVLKDMTRGMISAEKSPQDRSLFSDDVISTGVTAALRGDQPVLGTPGNQPQLTGGIYHSTAPNFSSYLEANLPKMEDDYRKAGAAKGWDQTMIDTGVDRLKSRVSEIASGENGQIKVLGNSLKNLIMDEKHPITNVAMLTNNPDPKVRAAWSDYSQKNPAGAWTLERMTQANAAGRMNTYGTDFYHHLIEILDGESKPEDLGNYIGSERNSPITNSGWSAIDKEFDSLQTPEGKGFAAAESAFLKAGFARVTGESVMPGIDSALRQKELQNWMYTVMPMIQAGRASGKTAHELFDPNSKDYVGKTIVEPSFTQMNTLLETSILNGTATGNEVQYAQMHNVTGGQVSKANDFNVNNINNKADLDAAAHNGKLSLKEYTDRGIALGIFPAVQANVPRAGE